MFGTKNKLNFPYLQLNSTIFYTFLNIFIIEYTYKIIYMYNFITIVSMRFNEKNAFF